MARGRMLNTTIATDKRLADLSLEAEFLFLKTIPHLDRDGLILGDAPVLWAQICPRRPDLLPMTEDAIEQWIDAKLVIAYDTPDGRALFFPNFSKNQTGLRYDREPASTIICPPDYCRTPAGLVPADEQPMSDNHPDIIRQSSGNHPAEVKRREVKRREENDAAPAARPINPHYETARALAEVCHMDFGLNEKKCLKHASDLRKADPPPTPELVRQRYNGGGWWYENDWRGKKGELPNLATIRETWGSWGKEIPEKKPYASEVY